MLSRFMLMLTLILAGEVVYMFPFGLTRFFRPSLLEAFGITNTQLGDIFAVYGVLAMIAYFPGGALADRFSARALLTISLLATGLGGIYLATYPGLFGLVMLFGYWGVTTILLFWAAMIRATREWGGDDAQGRAFGILEGGRGVVAVLFATAGVALFAIFMPDDVQSVSDAGRRAALREVILLYSGVTLATGILTWLVIPHRKHIGDSSRSIFKPAFAVLNRPLVWAQAAVIICAYCGYKGLDNYSLYAVQVLGDVPPFLTGAVAGTVSFIGYTPEIFFGPITGRILDANPGSLGF
ncbi:MAG: MFS transporter, partial [Woeseiaceae bacterium]